MTNTVNSTHMFGSD